MIDPNLFPYPHGRYVRAAGWAIVAFWALLGLYWVLR